jgi:DNA-binding transcriptional ArsR family regulator
MYQSTNTQPQLTRPALHVVREDSPDYRTAPKKAPVVIVDLGVGETILGTLGASAFGVYWHLCRRANNGQCWPSLDDIAEATMLSRMHVTRMLSALEEGGYITRERRTTPRRMATSTLYTIVVTDNETGCNTACTSSEHVVHPEVTGTSSELVRTRKDLGNDSPKAARRKPETDAPDELALREQDYDWAAAKGFSRAQCDRECEAMLNWHRGKGNRWRDWTAAWRTWMGKATPKADPAPATNGKYDIPMPLEIQRLPHNSGAKAMWEIEHTVRRS